MTPRITEAKYIYKYSIFSCFLMDQRAKLILSRSFYMKLYE